MEAIGFRSTPLWRQANEANEIGKHSSKNVLNRRREWDQNLPPKLSLEATEQVKFQKRKTPPPPLQRHSPRVSPDKYQSRKLKLIQQRG